MKVSSQFDSMLTFSKMVELPKVTKWRLNYV